MKHVDISHMVGPAVLKHAIIKFIASFIFLVSYAVLRAHGGKLGARGMLSESLTEGIILPDWLLFLVGLYSIGFRGAKVYSVKSSLDLKTFAA